VDAQDASRQRDADGLLAGRRRSVRWKGLRWRIW
jgi:hypothetical protein